MDFQIYRRLADFVHLEARLADEHRYEEWLALWADKDTLYWIPNKWGTEGTGQLSMIHENRIQLDDRIFRMSNRFNHSQTPRSKLLRVVSDIQAAASDGGWDVSSAYMLGELRNDVQNTYFARAAFKLVEIDGALRIRQKTVFLLNSNTPTPNMTFII